MTTECTGFWTFLCNPKIWAVDDFLATNPTHVVYKITKWQEKWFDINQLGLIRVGYDGRSKKVLGGRSQLEPGIYAIVQVMNKPTIRNLSNNKFWHKSSSFKSQDLSVDLKIVKNLLNSPLTLNDLNNDPNILDKYLLKGIQASSWPLDPGTFKRILERLSMNYDFS